MNNLTLDENHIYRLNGVIIPGYSEVASAMGITNFSGISDLVLEPARKFGTAGHYATRLWDEKRLDESSLSTPLIPCLEAYKSALVEHKIEILPEYIEKPIYSPIYRYGTTPDRICLVNGELSILELKFVEQMSKATGIQTAAQKLAVEGYYKIKIKCRYGLQITQEGKAILDSYKNKADENTWLCFLGSYNWLKINGRLKNGK